MVLAGVIGCLRCLWSCSSVLGERWDSTPLWSPHHRSSWNRPGLLSSSDSLSWWTLDACYPWTSWGVSPTAVGATWGLGFIELGLSVRPHCGSWWWSGPQSLLYATVWAGRTSTGDSSRRCTMTFTPTSPVNFMFGPFGKSTVEMRGPQAWLKPWVPELRLSAMKQGGTSTWKPTGTLSYLDFKLKFRMSFYLHQRVVPGVWCKASLLEHLSRKLPFKNTVNGTMRSTSTSWRRPTWPKSEMVLMRTLSNLCTPSPGRPVPFATYLDFTPCSINASLAVAVWTPMDFGNLWRSQQQSWLPSATSTTRWARDVMEHILTAL